MCCGDGRKRGANLEVFSFALQNRSLKEEDLLGRQTPITAERKEQHFHYCYLLCYNLTSLHIATCIEIWFLFVAGCKVTGYKTRASQRRSFCSQLRQISKAVSCWDEHMIVICQISNHLSCVSKIRCQL